MKDYMPYIVSVLCAVISGITSYLVTRKQTKEDMKKLEKQYELDLDKEKERFAMEKEKMEIEHQHQIELLQKENENKLGENLINSVVNEAVRTPEFRKQIAQSIGKSKTKK